jgi:hypothetical protein
MSDMMVADTLTHSGERQTAGCDADVTWRSPAVPCDVTTFTCHEDRPRMSRDEAPEEDLVSLGLKPVVTTKFEKILLPYLPMYLVVGVLVKTF